MSLDNNCPGQLQVELRIKAMQPVLIPGHMDLDTGLSPGAPVNNCRWASTHVSWDQSINSLETARS